MTISSLPSRFALSITFASASSTGSGRESKARGRAPILVHLPAPSCMRIPAGTPSAVPSCSLNEPSNPIGDATPRELQTSGHVHTTPKEQLRFPAKSQEGESGLTRDIVNEEVEVTRRR